MSRIFDNHPCKKKNLFITVGSFLSCKRIFYYFLVYAFRLKNKICKRGFVGGSTICFLSISKMFLSQLNYLKCSRFSAFITIAQLMFLSVSRTQLFKLTSSIENLPPMTLGFQSGILTPDLRKNCMYPSVVFIMSFENNFLRNIYQSNGILYFKCCHLCYKFGNNSMI